MKKQKVKILLYGIIEALLIMMEIYVMLHLYKNMLLVFAIGICIVLILVFLISSIIDMNQTNKELDRKEYEDIFRAQKASYLAFRKHFDSIENRLETLEENTSFPAEEIISAQKAVAKVTISRSKENTDALMNSNDELIQQFFQFEEKLSEQSEELLKKQQELLEQTKTDLIENHRELQEKVSSMNLMIEEMKSNLSMLEGQQIVIDSEKLQKVENSQVEVAQAESEEKIGYEDISLEEALEELKELDSEVQAMKIEVPSQIVDYDKENQVEEPTQETKAEVEIEEKPAMPELSDDPNKQLSPDEIAAMFANASAIAEEPKEEEKPAMPELSDDPNKQLSSDEIAAMFANASAIAEELNEEEKPAMPELSDDPNKQLSPDEIAAMFANASEITEASEETGTNDDNNDEMKIGDVDLSDPNKMLSPEEIEALFANL